MRDIIEMPDRRFFTQGSIFDGLVISDEVMGFGIIISARCDIANSKSRNILFLPIYNLSDWLRFVGNDVVVRRSYKSLRSQLVEKLKKLEMPESCLDTYPAEEIIRVASSNRLFNGDNFSEMLYAYKNKEINLKISVMKKEREKLIDSVISNNESDAYFLEQVHSNKVLQSYVVDLSEPMSIPRSLADELRKGLNPFSEDKNGYFCYDNGDVSNSYISVLKSPYIEHLLQKFSYYYSRIGTEDLDSEFKKIIQEEMANG